MSYNGKFKDVKESLLKLYLEDSFELRQALKGLKWVEVYLKPTQFGDMDADMAPKIFITDGTKEFRVTDAVKFPTVRNGFEPDDRHVHVGYKRYDDWLDKKGKLLYKSKKFRRKLEMLRCDKKPLKWLWYKLCKPLKR